MNISTLKAFLIIVLIVIPDIVLLQAVYKDAIAEGMSVMGNVDSNGVGMSTMDVCDERRVDAPLSVPLMVLLLNSVDVLVIPIDVIVIVRLTMGMHLSGDIAVNLVRR